jgi:hypothetical protein
MLYLDPVDRCLRSKCLVAVVLSVHASCSMFDSTKGMYIPERLHGRLKICNPGRLKRRALGALFCRRFISARLFLLHRL